VLPPACKTLIGEIRAICGQLDPDGKGPLRQLLTPSA
jgi:hypothetical protein